MSMRERAASSEATGADEPGAAAPPSGDGKVPESAVNPGGGGLTRVTVNLNRQAVIALDGLNELTGYSKTDVINRALQVYKIFYQIMERDGGTVTVMDSDGQVERIHIV